MKSVEERLRELPRIAAESGLEADEKLKTRILRAAREGSGRKTGFRRWALVPIACALAALLFVTVVYPALNQPAGPLITGQSAGDGKDSGVGELSGDVRGGSVSITSDKAPSWQSIWASGSNGNFPMIAVNGRYYRLLTSPGKISSSLLGDEIARIAVKTDEPALCREEIFSNAVDADQPVYTVKGMEGAAVAAYVDGTLRVFQRAAFSGNAILNRETLGDTLKASNVASIDLTGVGSVSGDEAVRLMSVLLNNAVYQNASCPETDQTILFRLNNGLTMQMCVKGDNICGCGTWSCPDFFEAFPAAGQ